MSDSCTLARRGKIGIVSGDFSAFILRRFMNHPPDQSLLDFVFPFTAAVANGAEGDAGNGDSGSLGPACVSGGVVMGTAGVEDEGIGGSGCAD